jgi:hypothetical protein
MASPAAALAAKIAASRTDPVHPEGPRGVRSANANAEREREHTQR